MSIEATTNIHDAAREFEEMQGKRISAAAIATLVIASPVHAAAQTTSRGVEVLRPAARPAPVPVPTPPPARVCPRPFAATDVTLRADTRSAPFDAALRNRFVAKAPVVTIDMAEPFPLGSEGPAPLAAWLKEAKAKGGIVSVDQYCEAPRGLFSWLRKVFGGGAQSGYDSIDGYDAVLHADGANGVVTQVEFRRRAGA